MLGETAVSAKVGSLLAAHPQPAPNNKAAAAHLQGVIGCDSIGTIGK
jgi:hypothetical protein